MKNKHIVLDIDKTLLTTIVPLQDDKFSSVYNKAHFIVADNQLSVLRPHLRAFLIFCFHTYKSVSLYSAGANWYVQKIADFLLELVNSDNDFESEKTSLHNFQNFSMLGDKCRFNMVYSYDDCERVSLDDTTFMLIKPLSKMFDYTRGEMNEQNTIMIDDKDYYGQNNPDNMIIIEEFNGQVDDKNLLKLAWFLYDMKGCEDVRDVDKNNWEFNCK